MLQSNALYAAGDAYIVLPAHVQQLLTGMATTPTCFGRLFVLQGMSISKLRVHLGRAFAAGMVYVGLSRATSLAGLQVGITTGQPGGLSSKSHM